VKLIGLCIRCRKRRAMPQRHICVECVDRPLHEQKKKHFAAVRDSKCGRGYGGI